MNKKFSLLVGIGFAIGFSCLLLPSVLGSIGGILEGAKQVRTVGLLFLVLTVAYMAVKKSLGPEDAGL